MINITGICNNTEPLEPVYLIESSYGQTYINLKWFAPPNNGRVTNYHIYQDNILLETVNSNLLSYGLTGLSKGRYYSFYIVSEDAVGNLSQSNLLSIRTKSGIF